MHPRNLWNASIDLFDGVIDMKWQQWSMTSTANKTTTTAVEIRASFRSIYGICVINDDIFLFFSLPLPKTIEFHSLFYQYTR